MFYLILRSEAREKMGPSLCKISVTRQLNQTADAICKDQIRYEYELIVRLVVISNM